MRGAIKAVGHLRVLGAGGVEFRHLVCQGFLFVLERQQVANTVMQVGYVGAHDAGALVGCDQPVQVLEKCFGAEALGGPGELNHLRESNPFRQTLGW